MEHETKDFFEKLHNSQTDNWVSAINSSTIIKWIDSLLALLFPEKPVEINEIATLWNQNKADFILLLSEINLSKLPNENHSLATSLYQKIPDLYGFLQQDVQALLDSDPAAASIQEIINSYPGFKAIAVYRIANAIAKLKVNLLPRILTEYAHSKTGIDIHPNAKIGVPFVIDHGTGIVIGETAEIGKNVHVYQGVTLGALQVEKNMEEKKRHPTVEDHVIIYANATILGGSTVIGNHSIIGGNTFITKSVNPYSIIMQSTKNTFLNQEEVKNSNLFNI